VRNADLFEGFQNASCREHNALAMFYSSQRELGSPSTTKISPRPLGKELAPHLRALCALYAARADASVGEGLFSNQILTGAWANGQARVSCRH
jgi:hypothetical protein